MTQQLTSSPQKKVLDEGTFQEMLAAAYVLQQRSRRPGDPSTRSIEILSEIVRIQRSIRSGKLNLAATVDLISQQLQKFTGADGVAIGIVKGEELIYLAALGIASRDMGRHIPGQSSHPAYCVRTGNILESANVQEDSNMLTAGSDVDFKSFIAVPVEYEGSVVAVLEARFLAPSGFVKDDVHTCELMAPLVREVIARAGRRGANKARQSAEPQVQTGLFPAAEAVEAKALAPQPVVEESPLREVSPAPALSNAGIANTRKALSEGKSGEIESPQVDASVCRGCGQPMGEDEAFCGKCGTERLIKPDGPLQSKWASLWYMNQARRNSAAVEEGAPASVAIEKSPKSLTRVEAETDQGAVIDQETEDAGKEPVSSEHMNEIGTVGLPAPAKQSLSVEWLPNISGSPRVSWLRRQWRANRANFYVAGAAILLFIALSGWGTAPDFGSKAAANSAPQLSLFDRVLVGLGIAEAPEAPVSAGNPDVPVWVDTHTALYYCPGADLYGRTDGGKIATQRSAQLDQFEPAHRKPCH